MSLTGHPPHRPVRAELPHTVPASGNDDQTADWARNVYTLAEAATHFNCLSRSAASRTPISPRDTFLPELCVPVVGG